jgi:EamA domain-containing membrane protein RarD
VSSAAIAPGRHLVLARAFLKEQMGRAQLLGLGLAVLAVTLKTAGSRPTFRSDAMVRQAG